MLGRALPLVDNPLTIAEEFAMIDQISGGRLVAGFVRGIGTEYHASGTNPAHSHERFHEAHDLILQAWTRPGPFRFDGKHYKFNYVNPWPRPLQEPHPPVWLPSQGSSETILWTAAKARKYTYLQTFSPFVAMKKSMDLYRETARRDGYEAAPSQLGWGLPIYVAETDAIARREAQPHIEAFFNKFLKVTLEMRMPPGYSSIASTKHVIETRMKARQAFMSMDFLIDQGWIVVGSPATVRERLEAAQAEIDVGTLVVMGQFGTLPHDLTRKNIELFAAEVIPHWRRGARAAA